MIRNKVEYVGWSAVLVVIYVLDWVLARISRGYNNGVR